MGLIDTQASTLTAGPLARKIFSPSLASRASGSSSDRQFGPQGVRSALARNVNQI